MTNEQRAAIDAKAAEAAAYWDEATKRAKQLEEELRQLENDAEH